jgi:hypothetical protein
MSRTKTFLLCAGLACATACGRKKVESAADLQAVFAPANNPALAQSKPEIKAWIDQAVTSLKADDQVGAVMSLRSLRSSGQLTADQTLAIEDMMVRAQQTLAERAARGDQQAINALNMLMMNPR